MLTKLPRDATHGRVGRKKLWNERIQLPLAAGTTARIDALLALGEARLDFIRGAIERELNRRERIKKPENISPSSGAPATDER